MDRRRFLLTSLTGALAIPFGAEALQAERPRPPSMRTVLGVKGIVAGDFGSGLDAVEDAIAQLAQERRSAREPSSNRLRPR